MQTQDSYDYCSGLKTLQIELSTVCNALCLGCVRTDAANFNRSKKSIPKTKYIDVQIIQTLLHSEKAKSLKKIEFCGNIDEPLAHPKLLDIVSYIQSHRPDIRVSVHTNGGIGNEETFFRLSQMLSRCAPGSNIRFSIDGLEDTNHLYRQNVRWGKLFSNLKSAVAGGVPVIWQFLVFPWNEHQVEPAKVLATDIGCSEFWIRPDRSKASMVGLQKINLLKAQNKDGGERKGGLSDLRDYVSFKGSPIVCLFRENKMLFLSWEGKVWPCCFISNILYESDFKKRLLEKYLLAGYPANFNNLYENSFDEVLESPLFKNDLVQSWSDGGRKDKRAFRCVEKCATARKRTSDQKPDDRTHHARIEL